MKIVAGGDSLIWGSELVDSPHGGVNGYSRNTFTALLAGKDYICAAYPGIGNTEIAQRVMDACSNNTNGAIVCWSWPSRDNQLTSDNQILQLQEFLTYLNIPYLFTCADNCVITDNPEIDWSKWYMFPVIPNSGWHPNELPRGFYQWALENKYELALKDKHPLEQAHRDAAILIKEKFNELVKEHCKSY